MNNPPEKGIYDIVLHSVREYKMFNFMCSLLILLILSAVLQNYEYAYIVINILSIIVILSGVYAASANKRDIYILLILGLPWFLSDWIYLKSTNTVFLGFFFFLYVTLTIFEMILKSKEITPNTLYGAVNVYLLLGLLWASIYGLINHLAPGSIFQGSGVTGEMTSSDIIYFSYTTLTSLGYGDISTVTPSGRIMSVLEAVIGQLFIAFMVARLIGIYTKKS